MFTVFRAEGMGFCPWPGHGDCTAGQGSLQLYVLHPGVQLVTNIRWGNKPVIRWHLVKRGTNTRSHLMP